MSISRTAAILVSLAGLALPGGRSPRKPPYPQSNRSPRAPPRPPQMHPRSSSRFSSTPPAACPASSTRPRRSSGRS
jgi:hypothetical protein